MKKKISLILFGFMLLLITTSADELTQNFDTWDTTDNNPHTITNTGWILSDSIIKDASFDMPNSMPNAAFFTVQVVHIYKHQNYCPALVRLVFIAKCLNL